MAGTEWAGRTKSVFCWFTLLWGLGSGLLYGQADRPRQTGAASLQQFLEVRGLDRLLIRQLETQLARESDLQRQVDLGRRLAGLYRAALLSDQRQEVDRAIIDRAEQLLATYPSIDRGGLALAVEHARYLDVEMAFRQWWFGGRDPALQGEVAGELASRCDQLEALSVRLETDVRQIQILPEATQAEVAGKDRLLVTAEGRLSHCHYLLGWASYYRGILKFEGDHTWLLKSQKYFRQFLQLPVEGPLPELETWQPDLQSTWRWRSLLGIAMGWRARGEQQRSDALFQFLERIGGDRAEGQRLDAWNLESMVLARQWERASEYVEQLDTKSWNRVRQRAFWSRVLEASRAAQRAAPDQAEVMRTRALLALVRSRESLVLQHWKSEQEVGPVSSQFLRGWVEGYLAWAGAEQGEDGLVGVGETLSRAIEAADESTLAEDLARCRFLKALVDFRLGRLADSANQFSAVAHVLREKDPQMAAESSWMNVRAWTAMAIFDSRKTSEALAAIDQFASQFPASPLAEKIPFQKLRLSCHVLPPRRAIARLEAFQQGHPDVHQVRLELARNYYRFWQEQLQVDRPAALAALAELERVDRQLREDPQVTADSKLRSALWVIDAMLEMDLTDGGLQALLETAVELADSAGVSASTHHLLVYYQMMFASQNGEQETAVELARELAMHSVGTPFERSALLYLVESYCAGGELDADNRSVAIADLARLVDLLGDDTRSLTQSKNSRIALFRLGELCLLDQQWERADQYLDQLVNVFPDRREYLVASARAKTGGHKLEQALPRWRLLAKGAEPGTELWYEAKYQLARCLGSTGDASAAKLLRQTMQLSPSMPENWARRYALLAQQLELED